MKREIIDTTSLWKEKPKKQTWFDFNGIIFISVIYGENRKRKSHFRRKSRPDRDLNKQDNEMGQWHLEWQFLKIEPYYGLEKTGNRTFEITVKHENEYHRIDSIVNNIAIEFQHTLSVSINEMESRFLAHKSLGFHPYLVLDFTNFCSEKTIEKVFNLSRDDYAIYFYKYKDNIEVKNFLKALKKWLYTQYYEAQNLFLHFSDTIVRLTPNSYKDYRNMDESYFIENLLELENILSNEDFQENERRRQKEAERKKQEDYNRKIERIDAIQKNKQNISKSENYKFYRKALKNDIVKKAIAKTITNDIEYVKYETDKTYSPLHQSRHIYRLYESYNSEMPILEIQYINIGQVKNKKYHFIKTKIEIIKSIGYNNTGIKRIILEQNKFEKFKLKSIRQEIMKGILHSLENEALISYNDKGAIENKEYYLFNHKVSETVFAELSDYYRVGYEVENISKESISAKSNIQNEDKMELIKYIYQNDLPIALLFDYYRDLNEPAPFYDLQEDWDW